MGVIANPKIWKRGGSCGRLDWCWVNIEHWGIGNVHVLRMRINVLRLRHLRQEAIDIGSRMVSTRRRSGIRVSPNVRGATLNTDGTAGSSSLGMDVSDTAGVWENRTFLRG
jgi:hypothetical protein